MVQLFEIRYLFKNNVSYAQVFTVSLLGATYDTMPSVYAHNILGACNVLPFSREDSIIAMIQFCKLFDGLYPYSVSESLWHELCETWN